jgi:hypothetical protein
MSTREVLREEEWTHDGRMLPAGSVTWAEEPLPMIVGDEIVGTLTGIRRAGNKILVETSLDLADDMIITADCDIPNGSAVEVAPGHITLTGIRLRAGYVNHSSFYPWSDVKRGSDADAS